jgi:hypothetical protein
MSGDGSTDGAGYMEKLTDDMIVAEGFLRVRGEHGLPGLRPWLLRFVVMRWFYGMFDANVPALRDRPRQARCSSAVFALGGSKLPALRPCEASGCSKAL